MIYPRTQRLGQLVANIGGALMVGLVFAVVGLNAASGCGERHGQCIGVRDFIAAPTQLAAR